MIWCGIKHFVVVTVEMKENKRLSVEGFEWASWRIGRIGCYNTKCLIRKGLDWAVRVADGRSQMHYTEEETYSPTVKLERKYNA